MHGEQLVHIHRAQDEQIIIPVGPGLGVTEGGSEGDYSMSDSVCTLDHHPHLPHARTHPCFMLVTHQKI